MNVAELVNAVAAETGHTPISARSVLTAVFDQISAAAAKGDDVTIPGFGKFTVKDRAAREGRNPATGKPMSIAASKKVAFTASKVLKDKL